MFARQRRQAVDPVSGNKLSTSLVPLIPACADSRQQSQAAGLDLLSNLIHGESSHHLFKRHEWTPVTPSTPLTPVTPVTPVTPANTDENDISHDNNNHERSKSSEDSGESGGSEESSGSIDREEEVNPVDRLIVNEQSENSEDSGESGGSEKSDESIDDEGLGGSISISSTYQSPCPATMVLNEVDISPVGSNDSEFEIQVQQQHPEEENEGTHQRGSGGFDLLADEIIKEGNHHLFKQHEVLSPRSQVLRGAPEIGNKKKGKVFTSTFDFDEVKKRVKKKMIGTGSTGINRGGTDEMEETKKNLIDRTSISGGAEREQSQVRLNIMEERIIRIEMMCEQILDKVQGTSFNDSSLSSSHTALSETITATPATTETEPTSSFAFIYPDDYFKQSEQMRTSQFHQAIHKDLENGRKDLHAQLLLSRATLEQKQQQNLYSEYVREDACRLHQISTAAAMFAPKSETMKQWMSQATQNMLVAAQTELIGRVTFVENQKGWQVKCKEEEKKQLDALHAASEVRGAAFASLLDSMQGKRRVLASQDRHYP